MLYNIDASQIYPCVYREHLHILRSPATSPGLSLCVQGTLVGLIWQLVKKRFIPVCTGNTRAIIHNGKNWTVYPCVYREHTNYNILFYN